MLQLEAGLLPLLAHNLDPDQVEYLEETMEIISALAQNVPVISEGLWQLFPVIMRAWDNHGYDFLRDMLPAIECYVRRGGDVFVANEEAKAMVRRGARARATLDRLRRPPNTRGGMTARAARQVLGVGKKIFEDEDANQRDMAFALQLLETALHCCPGRVDDMVQPYLELAGSRLFSAKPGGPCVRVFMLEAFLNALMYNTEARRAWASSASHTTAASDCCARFALAGRAGPDGADGDHRAVHADALRGRHRAAARARQEGGHPWPELARRHRAHPGPAGVHRRGHVADPLPGAAASMG
jgi:hypothetical protein